MVFWRPPEVGDESRYANPDKNSKNRNQPPDRKSSRYVSPCLRIRVSLPADNRTATTNYALTEIQW